MSTHSRGDEEYAKLLGSLSLLYAILFFSALNEEGTCYAYKQADGTWVPDSHDPAPDIVATDFGSMMKKYTTFSCIMLVLGFVYFMLVLNSSPPSPNMPGCSCVRGALLTGGLIQTVWNLYLGFNGGVAACQCFLHESYFVMKMTWWIDMITLGILIIAYVRARVMAHLSSRNVASLPVDDFKS